MFARIDRRRKLPVTIILRALGMNEAEILATFFDTNTFFVSRDEVSLQLVPQRLRGETATFEIRIGDQVIVEEGRRITARHVRQLEDAKVTRLRVPREYVYGKVLAHDVVNTDTGEIIAKANEVLTAASVEKLIEAGITAGQHALHQRSRPRRLHLRHAAHRSDQDAPRGAGRDLPHDASRRAADQGCRREPVLRTCSSTPSATTSRPSAA